MVYVRNIYIYYSLYRCLHNLDPQKIQTYLANLIDIKKSLLLTKQFTQDQFNLLNFFGLKSYQLNVSI